MKLGTFVIAASLLATASCKKKENDVQNKDKAADVGSGSGSAAATAPTPAPTPDAAVAEAPMTYEEAINKQYGRDDLGQNILAALTANGKDVNHLTRDDIMGFTEFHTLGRPATIELAKLGKIKKGEKVVDLGSGLGGPAMTVAAETGAEVTGVELTKSYYETAKMLAEKVGAKGVTFINGSALSVPLPDASVDVVWMQHVEMNIPDKAKLFHEIARLLKPGGRFVTHSFIKGTSDKPTDFPQPWADTQDRSFLETEEEFKKNAADAGLKLVTWKNTDDVSLAAFKAASEKTATPPPAGSPPPLALNLLMQKSTHEKLTNLAKDIEGKQVGVFMAVFEKAKK